jgi:hypothetical protein
MYLKKKQVNLKDDTNTISLEGYIGVGLPTDINHKSFTYEGIYESPFVIVLV